MVEEYNERTHDYLKTTDILNEGRLFAYKGKVLAVPEITFQRYITNQTDIIPFVYDISIGLQEQANQDLACIDALTEIDFIAGKYVDDKKFLDGFLNSLVETSEFRLLAHAKNVGSTLFNHDDYVQLSMADEENGAFYNSLGQGFKPKQLQNAYKRSSEKAIDDVYKPNKNTMKGSTHYGM